LKAPVVVRRGADEAFAVDEALSAALNEQGGITTIAALRRAVAKRRGMAAPRRLRGREP
jgi:DNA-binding phage protein